MFYFGKRILGIHSIVCFLAFCLPLAFTVLLLYPGYESIDKDKDPAKMRLRNVYLLISATFIVLSLIALLFGLVRSNPPRPQIKLWKIELNNLGVSVDHEDSTNEIELSRLFESSIGVNDFISLKFCLKKNCLEKTGLFVHFKDLIQERGKINDLRTLYNSSLKEPKGSQVTAGIYESFQKRFGLKIGSTEASPTSKEIVLFMAISVLNPCSEILRLRNEDILQEAIEPLAAIWLKEDTKKVNKAMLTLIHISLIVLVLAKVSERTQIPYQNLFDATDFNESIFEEIIEGNALQAIGFRKSTGTSLLSGFRSLNIMLNQIVISLIIVVCTLTVWLNFDSQMKKDNN